MAFNGTEGDHISLSKAGDYTKTWRDTYSTLKKGVFIGKDNINDILNQPNCEGIRIYFGINDNSDNCAVLVGAKADENDMVHGVIVNGGKLCPTICGVDNDLNSD